MPYLSIAQAASPDAKLYYQEFGQGTPVIFTSAGLLTHKQWDEQVALLSTRHRTITYDWMGTGRSDRPNLGYDVELAVDSLCALLEQRAQAPTALVGHGIGCHISILAALKRPGLVSRLVLCSGAPWYKGNRDGAGGFSEEFMAFWRARMTLTTMPAAQAIADLADEYLYNEPPHGALGAAVLAQALDWPMHVFKSYTESMASIDLSERIGEIQCPTLVMHGRHDRKQRYAGGRYLADHIAKARLVTFEDSAHMIMFEELGRFSGELSDFLAQA